MNTLIMSNTNNETLSKNLSYLKSIIIYYTM